MPVDKGCEWSAERCHDTSDSNRVFADTDKIKPANKRRHCDHEGKNLPHHGHLANRSTISSPIVAVLFGHANDSFSKTGNDGVKLREFLRCRERPDSDLLMMADDSRRRVGPLTLKIPASMITLRQVRRCD